MESKSSSASTREYLRALREIAAARLKSGGRGKIESDVKQLACSAVMIGIPKSKVAGVLRVGWATLQKWCLELEPELRKNGLIKPKATEPIVQTLAVAEPVRADALTSKVGVEIRIGDVFVRIANGGLA